MVKLSNGKKISLFNNCNQSEMFHLSARNFVFIYFIYMLYLEKESDGTRMDRERETKKEYEIHNMHLTIRYAAKRISVAFQMPCIFSPFVLFFIRFNFV